MIKSINSRVILILIGVAILIFLSYFYENKVFYIHFVDEEDNMVLGKYLLKGEKLYSDLFSHHQPLSYIFSAGIQKATNPNSIALLIKRHREFLIAWSFIWAVFLLWKFRLPGLIFISIYEMSKILILGNLFISEALAVYPMIYILGLVFSGSKIVRLEWVAVGVAFAFVFLFLLPLWPLIFTALLIIINRDREKISDKLLLFGLGVLPFIIILFFIDLGQYYYNAFYINFNYYIPNDTTKPSPDNILNSFMTPLLSLFSNENSKLILITKTLTVSIIFYSFFMIRKRYKFLLTGIVLLGLANIRYIPPGQEIYRGFHSIPWFALLILFFSFLSYKLISYKKPINIFSSVIILIVILVTFYSVKDVLFVGRDKENDLYINYSDQFSIGEAIRIMKSDEDRLFIIPDEWLVYWQADIKHASFMVNYYPWMEKVPKIRQSVDRMFDQNPPEFLYCHCSEDKIEEFSGKYHRMKKDKKETFLLVRKDKFSSLDNSQKRNLMFHNFDPD